MKDVSSQEIWDSHLDLGQKLVKDWGLPNTVTWMQMTMVPGKLPEVTVKFYPDMSVPPLQEVTQRFRLQPVAVGQPDGVDAMTRPSLSETKKSRLPLAGVAVVVYGPQGCGKTFHAQELAELLGCTSIVDEDGGWALSDGVKPGALHLTCEALKDIPVRVLAEARVFSFGELSTLLTRRALQA